MEGEAETEKQGEVVETKAEAEAEAEAEATVRGQRGLSPPCRSSKCEYDRVARRWPTLLSFDAYCHGLMSKWTLSRVAADLMGRYIAQRSWLVRRSDGSSSKTVANAWGGAEKGG